MMLERSEVVKKNNIYIYIYIYIINKKSSKLIFSKSMSKRDICERTMVTYMVSEEDYTTL